MQFSFRNEPFFNQNNEKEGFGAAELGDRNLEKGLENDQARFITEHVKF